MYSVSTGLSYSDIGPQKSACGPIRCCRRRRDYVPSTALFDFGDVELKEVIQPSDEFLSVKRDALAFVLRSKGGSMKSCLLPRGTRSGTAHLDSDMMDVCVSRGEWV